MRKFFKYFCYTLLFMVMSIGSAYGAITISMNNASNMQNSMNGSESEPLPEQLTSIYENIANEDAMQINLSAGINAGSENYIIDVEVEMDTSAGYENLALDGSIKIAEAGLARASALYDIDFSYQNGMAFFDMFGGRIALDTTTIIEPVMSILKILNIQIPELGSLDLNSLTPEVILGMLTNFTEEKGDGQITLVIDVPVIGKINLICDLDYCVQELALPEIAFNESSSLTVSSKITYPEFVEIEKKVESDYIKVGGLLSSAESVLDYMNSEGIAFDFDFDFMGNKLTGSLQANLVDLTSMATIDLYGNELRLFAVDNIIYIEYGNILASFALSDFDKINNILKTYFNIDIPLDTITDILQSLKTGDFASLLDKFDLDISPSDIDLSILENVIVKGNLTALSLREIGDFGITTDDNGDLTKLAFSGLGVEAVLETTEYKDFALSYDKENYIDLAVMIPTVENAISILQSPTVSGEIVISLGDLQFPLQYAFDTAQMYGIISGEFLGGALKISLVDGMVYVSFANQPLVAIDMATIQADINEFLAQLELDVEFSSIAQIFAGLGLVFNQNGLLFTSLEQTDDGFILSTTSMDIVLSNSLKEIYVSTRLAGFGVDISILGGNAVVEKPTIENQSNFAEFKDMLYLAEAYIKSGLMKATEGAYNYFKQGNMAFDFEIELNGEMLCGKVDVDFANKALKLCISVGNENIVLVAQNKAIYLEFANIYAQFNINNLAEVERILSERFGIKLPLSIIIEIIDNIDGNTPFALLAGLGIVFDLSKIDLSFFDSIVVDGNTTTIPVEGIGEIALTLTDSVLSNIGFVGNGVTANVELVGFSNFDLAVEQDRYVDLAKFFPTIENAIDILNYNSLSGVIEANIDGFEIALDYVVDKTDVNDIYAEFTTNIYGADISIVYMNGKVYVNFADTFKLVSEIGNLPKAITEFITEIGYELPESDSAIESAVGAVLALLFDESKPFLVTAFVERDNGLDIEILNNITLSITNGNTDMVLTAGYDKYSAQISIFGGNLDIVRKEFVESEFNTIENLLAIAGKAINKGFIDLAEGAYNYFKSGLIGLDFSANYNGTALSGNIFFDLANKEILVSVIANEVGFNVIVKDNIAYLELGNIFAKFDVKDIDKLQQLLADEFGIDLPIDDIMQEVEDIQNSPAPLAKLAELGILINLSSFDLSFFDSIVVDGNTTTIPVEGVGEIALTLTDNVLSNIGFVGNGVTANVELVGFSKFDLSVEQDRYVDLAKFFPTIENAINILNCKSLSGVIEANIDGFEIALDYVVDKTDVNDIYAEFTTNIYGADISIVYMNGKVYVNFADTFKLVSEIGNLPKAITEFITEIGYELPESDSTIESAVGAVLALLFDESKPFLVTAFVERDNGLDIEILNNLTLSITNGNADMVLTAGYDKYSAQISILGGNLDIVRKEFVESEFNTIENLLAIAGKAINKGFIDLAEGAYNYFKSGLIGLDFSANYNGTALSGNIFFDLANKEILVSVIANEVGFNVIVKDNIAYLELGNIFAKFDVKDIDKIENLLKNKFEIEVPLTEIVDKLTNAEISDKPLEKLKDLGLVINLNGFDLSFFDSIVVDGNTTTIPVEGVGEIALTLTDKLLSNIGYTGNGLDVSANLVDFEEITLSVSEDTYIELISLLPTIGNAIDIVNCDAISGSMTLNIGLSEPIVVDYYVNKADLNDIYAEFATVIQGANTKVVYYGGKVYIEFATSIKLVADFETLPATIENLLAKADIAFDIKDDIDTSNIINAIFDVINPNKTAQLITSLTKLDNGLEIGAGGIVVTLTNGATQIDFATTDVSGVIIGGDVVNAVPVIDDSAYTPLDDVLDLVEAFLNMAKKKDFHIAGSFDVVGTLIGIDIKWNIPFDIRIKDTNGDIEMMMTMGEIPVVVGLNNDVPYKTGDTNGGKGRYVSIYIKEGAVYIYRTEYVNQLFGWDTRKYEKCTKITIDTFLANPMYYFQYALGFSDSIIEAMEDSFSKAFNRENPLDLNNVVNSLTVVDGENFELILNLAELANNDLLDTLTLDLGLGVDGTGESILERLGLEMFMPLASVFELTLSTDDTMIVDWGTEVDMSGLYNYVNGYQYAFDAEWEASNGSWSKASEITYTISFEENGGESVKDVTGAYGTEFSLPTLSPTQTDDGEKQISRIFMGWYTTSTFDEGTEFTGNTIPKGDKTLYAKWYEYVRYYRTISFVTNSSEVIEPVKALEGDNITLPSLSIKEEATETSVTIYTFVGWFADEALTNEFTTFVMPNENTTLYAKWEVAETEEAHLLQVYDGGNVIYTRYILAGNAIDLSGVAKVNDTTKFYLQANFTTAYEGDFTMPEENLTLYIRNQYTLTYKSEYGTVKDTSEKVWQGETLSLPAQSTYYDDDKTTRKITYTFSGYLVNGSVGELPSVMPNSDLSIVAVWAVETKKYYTITFNTGWVKCDEWMDNNSNASGKITCKSAPTAVAPLTLLEGTTFDPSVYNSTCKYEYKAVWIGANYNFKVLTWNTEGVKNISNGVSNDKYTKLTSYTVTGNATLYPTWGT